MSDEALILKPDGNENDTEELEALSFVVDFDVDDVKKRLDNGEEVRIETTKEQQAYLMSLSMLDMVSAKIEAMDDDRVDEIREEFGVSEEEVEVIKGFPDEDMTEDEEEMLRGILASLVPDEIPDDED